MLSKSNDPERSPLVKVNKSSSLVQPQTMATFVVDAEPGQVFLAHKVIACDKSLFFKAAFQSQMIEGAMQTMRLEDVETATFGLLVHWIYHKRIERQDSFVFGSAFEDEDEKPNSIPLAKLWELGQRTLILALQNAAMTEIWSELTTSCDEHVGELCEFASLEDERTTLKKAIVSKFAWDWCEFYMGRMMHRHPLIKR